MKTTESVTEIIIVFCGAAIFCAGLFAIVIWLLFHSLLWTAIVGGGGFVFLLFALIINYVGAGGRLKK